MEKVQVPFGGFELQFGKMDGSYGMKLYIALMLLNSILGTVRVPSFLWFLV